MPKKYTANCSKQVARLLNRRWLRLIREIFGDGPNLRNGELANKLNNLAFIVEGYDGHPEELYHISEVRRFYAELHRRWPWWLFFLNISNAGMAIPYFCLLGTIDAVKVDGSTDTGAIFNPVELLEIIRSDFPRMNLLFDHAGLSDNANDKRTHEIIQLFGYCSLIRCIEAIRLWCGSRTKYVRFIGCFRCARLCCQCKTKKRDIETSKFVVRS